MNSKLKRYWSIWAKSLGSKANEKDNWYSDKVAIIRTIIVFSGGYNKSIYCYKYFNRMEIIREFLDKNFKTIVTEIEGNYQVTFQGVGGQEGYIVFRKAKIGWNTKPISQNTYLVGDADMYQVIGHA